MKLYISSDMEGSAGITHWDETDYDRGGRWYDYFRGQMSREVAAACGGALKAGAEDVLVKDAHDSARNIIPDMLPEGVRMHRGWSGGIFSMVDSLDGFDALAFTGYHSPAHSNTNPLSHTMITSVDEVRVNGERMSEFHIHAYIAGMLKIPVVFISGDEGICETAKKLIPNITAVAVSNGVGNASISLHPKTAADKIYGGLYSALSGDWKSCEVKLPESFDVTVKYKNHIDAYRYKEYPGAKPVDEKTIAFSSREYLDIVRFLHFVL